MTKKVTDLPESTRPDDDDWFYAVVDGVSYKIQKKNLILSPRDDSWSVVDDFEFVRNARWLQTVVAGGTVTWLDVDSAGAPTKGFGWLELATANSATSSAEIEAKNKNIRVDLHSAIRPLVFEARVELPNNFANHTFEFGLRDPGLNSYAYIETTVLGEWQFQAKSAAGGGSQTTTLGSPTPVVGTSYVLRIEIDGIANTTKFYIDGVLEHTGTGISTPQGSDVLTWYSKLIRIASSDTALIDWIIVSGGRA